MKKIRRSAVVTGAGAVVGIGALLTASPAAAAVPAASAAVGRTAVTAHPLGSNVAANAAVGYTVSGTRCYTNGIKFTARMTERGFSGVQRFRQRAQLQEFTTRGWVAAGGIKTVNSTRFANDGRSFSFTLHWTGRHAANGASWREAWQGTYLNGNNAAIAKTKVIYVTCN